jgi:hypothetical protein
MSFKFNKKQAQEADQDILSELIAKCEDSMVSPFKKAKAVAVEVKPEDAEEASESPAEETAEGPEDDESKGKPDLSDMDMDDLLKLYEEIKSRKGE